MHFLTLTNTARYLRCCVAALSLTVSVTYAQAPIVPPGAPTITSVILGDGQATIYFAAPASNGGSAITSYSASCFISLGLHFERILVASVTAAASPIIVPRQSTFNPYYYCSVRAANIAGPGPVSASVNFPPDNPRTVTTLMPSRGAAAYGAPFTLSASVTGHQPTGTVSFSVYTGGVPVELAGCSSVALVAGIADCVVPGSLQTQAEHRFLAAYSGDLLNQSSSASIVHSTATSISALSVSANPVPPVVSGRVVTLTALVKMNTPVGTVTFFDSGVPIAGCAQMAISMLPDATDAAVANCTVTAPVSANGVKQYVATYFYPTGHISNRVFEQVNFDLRVTAQGPLDYTDMWWAGSAESGWGMSVAQHGPVQFNVIFAYDNLGKSLWYVMPGGSFNAAGTVSTGPLFLPASSPFSAYDASKFVIGAPVGIATITYTGPNAATLAYTINGVSATKSMQRQVFSAETSGPNLRTNDLWWATVAENGWGMNIAQQGRVLFPVWYTYDEAGRPTFFTAQGGSWNGTVWSGTVYSHIGSPWLGVTFNPSLSKATSVGTISLDFSDASNATMTTTVNGTTQAKHIERQSY